MIPQEKIKSIDYLFNRIISERVRDSMEPKYSLLLGAGCSFSSKIVTAKGIIEMLQSICYLRELPAESSDNPFINLDYGNIVSFLQEWYNSNKNNSDFIEFVNSEESQIQSILERLDDKDEYYLEIFNGLIKKNYSNFDELPLIQKNTILKSLKERYNESLISDLKYSFWFNKYSTSSEDIHSFLTELMNKKNPSEAYILLADLFVNNMFSVAFTTNFDNLLAESLSLLGIRSKEIWFDTNTVDNTLSKTSPNIVKLHGDYMYNNTKNLSSETRHLSKSLLYQLENVLSKCGLITIGYSGTDNSIMYALENLSLQYSFPLFWCELEDKIKKDEVSWRARNLVLNSSNSFFIPIKDFDSLIEKLRSAYMFFSKARKMMRGDNELNYTEKFYDEKYLITALLRTRTIIDKIINQNKEITQRVLPVPPPDINMLRFEELGDKNG